MVTKKHPTNLKKALVLALTVALAVMMVAPNIVNADTTFILDDAGDLTYGVIKARLDAEHPSTDVSEASAVGHAFNCSTGGYLSYITLIINKTGFPVSDLYMNISGYDSGTGGPNATIFETSDNAVIAGGVNVTADEYTWYFGGDVLLIEGEKYCYYVFSSAAGYLTDDVDAIPFFGSIDQSFAYGICQFSDGVWSMGGSDLAVEIGLTFDYGFDESGGSSSLTDYDILIDNFVAFVVPIIVMFLPALLLCFITRRVDKWLILIGIAIGAGLGYYFNLVPLWLVFLVTIGLIGMAYDSVRNH